MVTSVLVTGGIGYVGSHVAVELIEKGFDVHLVDNFSNSSVQQLDGIRQIISPSKSVSFYEANIGDTEKIQKILREQNIKAVIHCAGDKSVAESVLMPLKYYDNNVGSSISLFKAMESCGVSILIFSSSATVYGIPKGIAISEQAQTAPVNPYGKTKLTIENILNDLCRSGSKWKAMNLRYFNPAGAHVSGLIGDRFDNHPSNLFPIICQVLTGKRENLSVYGNNYDTADGTGERDYIHICDLAKAHVEALQFLLQSHNRPIPGALNLGIGKSVSVLEVIRAFEDSCNLQIPYKIETQRPGDIGKYFADPRAAQKNLSWTPQKSLKDMCRDTWRWAQNSVSTTVDEN